MIKILRKMFEDNPDKSTIVLKEKCSDCGRETTIEITATSGGFGLLGGALIKCSPDRYLTKCPACYRANPKTIHKLKAEQTFSNFKPKL